MRQNKSAKIKYLRDEPISKVDSPITKAISNEVINSNEGKIIGLLGGWGTGKSSIIKGIKDTICKNNCTFLEYDAWENENYPFKLGFLKFLFKELNAKNIDVSDESKALKDLQTVKEVQNEQKFSLINLPNLLIIISLLFFPFMLSKIEKGDVQNFISFNEILNLCGFSIYSSLIYFFITSNLLVLINFLIKKDRKCSIAWRSILSNTLLSIIVGRFFNNITPINYLYTPLFIWLIFNFKELVLKFFSDSKEFYILYGATPHTESIITVNKSPEPSFIDFKQIYEKTINKFKDKPIVIIIDNIDRINILEAKNIWAAINGMLLKDKKVFLIIPMDEEQIAQIYKDAEKTNDNETASFIQKTFDITFKIPPQILTDLEFLIKEKLSESLNITDIVLIKKIINVFMTRDYQNQNFKKSSYSGLATPRKIIKLLNEVVSLKLTSAQNNLTNINDLTLFIFCLHFNNIKDKLENNMFSKILPDTSNVFDEIETLDLASLYYLVDNSKALRIVKEEYIYNIIQEKKQLSKEDTQSIWIWDTLFDISLKSDYLPFSTLINFLAILQRTNDINPSNNYNEISNKLISAITKLSNIDDIIENSYKIIDKSINDLNANDQIIQNMLKLIYLKDTFENDAIKNSSNEWLNLSNVLLAKLDITKEEKYELLKTKMPNDFYQELIPIIPEDKFDLYDTMILEPEEISQIDMTFEHSKFILLNKTESASYKDGINIIIAKLQVGFSSDNLELMELFLSLDINNINEIEDLTTSLVSYVKSNSNLKNKELAKLWAIYITQHNKLKTNINTTYKTQIDSFANNTDDVFIKEFLETFLKLNNYDLNSITNIEQSKIKINAILDYIGNNLASIYINNTNLSLFANNYANSIWQQNNNEIIKFLLENQNLIKQICEIEISENNQEFIYKLIQEECGNALNKSFRNFINTIEDDTLLNNIQEQSFLFLNSILLGISKKNIYEKGIEYLILNKINDFIKFIKDNQLEVKIKTIQNNTRFINYIMSNSLKSIDFSNDEFLTIFESSIISWIKSSKDDPVQLFDNFILKLKNKDFIVKHKNILYNILTTDDDRKAFYEKWKDYEDVIKLYKLSKLKSVEDEPKV
ncbi:MAG: P-loop NTPase fold protein [Alphaproteobacteria bacterium]